MTRALLIVTMEPAAGQEEEFNDWYDTEHFPQRKALPGFLSASRWVCLDGWPRYLALYDMESPAAVETAAYRAVSGANGTPWSKRVLPRTIGRLRHVAVAVDAAPALTDEQASRLLAAAWLCPRADTARFADMLHRAAAALPHIARHRVFTAGAANDVHVWLIAAFDAPVSRADLDGAVKVDGRGAAIFNLYAPYFRASGY